MRIVVQGTERIKIVEWKQQDPSMRAVVQILPEPRIVDPEEIEAAKRNLQQMIQEALAAAQCSARSTCCRTRFGGGCEIGIFPRLDFDVGS